MPYFIGVNRPRDGESTQGVQVFSARRNPLKSEYPQYTHCYGPFSRKNLALHFILTHNTRANINWIPQ